MAESTSILSCRGLCKRYGRKTVLADLDLTLAAGEVLGLLGPNGAGKTTVIKSILGLVTPNAGAISLFGQDLFDHRREAIRQVGAVVEAPVFFEYMTALENLRYLTALTRSVPESRLLEMLAAVGLRDVAGRTVGTFSYGMKQRLGIAQALLPESRLLILDEPANGLDPHGIAGMRRLIQDLPRRLGLSVLVSSHLLGEIEQVCDRFIILHHGRKVKEGQVSDLRPEAGEVEVTFAFRAGDPAPDDVPGFLRLALAPENGAAVAVFLAKADEVPALVRELVRRGRDILAVRPRRQSLEELFIELTSDGERDVRIDAF